uniref:RxLR effector protein BLR38 n=1 Tax=Bremia lactucae TaxID=4779 RepID=BLR38_BRELC|nr:RecName: Full=RxLR effector protein BLR38; Flags: Precursor [Bremia lactucae]AYE92115.1 secreted RxLR effector [Bremia lactucae]
MHCTVFFLLIACAKSSYGQTRSVSTAKSESKSDEYSYNSDAIDQSRLLRGAVNPVSENMALRKFIFDMPEMLRPEHFEPIFINPAAVKEVIKDYLAYGEALCGSGYDPRLLALFGVRPTVLKQELMKAKGVTLSVMPSSRKRPRALDEVESEVENFRNVLKDFFIPPTTTNPSKLIPDDIETLVPEHVSAHFNSLVYLMYFAVLHFDSQELATMSSSVLLKYALQKNLLLREKIESGTLGEWERDFRLMRVLNVYKSEQT